MSVSLLIIFLRAFYSITILLGKLSNIQKNFSQHPIYSIRAPEIFILLSLRLQIIKSLTERLSHLLCSKPWMTLTPASYSNAGLQFLICFSTDSPICFFFFPFYIFKLEIFLKHWSRVPLLNFKSGIVTSNEHVFLSRLCSLAFFDESGFTGTPSQLPEGLGIHLIPSGASIYLLMTCEN